ncbi:phage tail length tape measure family protein [Rhizobium lentis]|uniref:Bacteriophage tail tape measure N-terminal domain-containing protein n=1 Tax=Rhizobium lentis TaxID=1138194 RepID=A0A7W8XEA1_9HYPH|nr:phage tail length tape measure family protein [Rhizobium lentis]MBB4574386.1 hypothetical protein [Rhizobium lentis]MBB5550312.1 hypothetical protein [Rhizobium lentis]MBB5560659.1 hypothetical protein [Rhizobium lentis]MBB5567244.1 hypothetical protein [Rhizobium lentis]
MANVEIRTLRVSAEMDASKYTAGAQQKAAADDQMKRSGKGLGDSFTENDQKISAATNVLAKLSRQYVDGYATTQRFNQAVNQLTRGVELGKIEMTQASAILDGIYRKYGMMADAARIAERGQIELSKAVQQANARFEEQSRVVPVNERRPAVGVANDNQAQFRRQNLGAQLQDIGVSLYGGMPLTTVLLQQGSQIVGIYGGNGGVNAVLKDLGAILAAAARYVGPFAAAGAAAYGIYKLFAANTVEAGLAVSDMTKALAAQASPMAAVQTQLTELQKLQGEYASALNTTARTHSVASAAIVEGTQREYEAKRTLLELELKRQEAARAVAQSELEITSLRLKSAVAQQVTTNMDLERQGFSDSRIGRFVQLPDSITGVEKTRDVLANNPLSDKVKELNANLSLTDIALQKLREGLGLVGPAASGQVGQINDLTKALEELRKVGTAAISPVDEATRRAMAAVPVINGVLDEESRRRVLAGQRAAQQRIDNQNPTVINGDGARVAVPVPGQRPNVELEGLPGDAKAGKSAAEAYRDLIKNANDRIEQMKLEASVAGETGIAAQKMRMELELLQQAQDKGRTVTADQRAEIEKLSEAYAKAATEAAKVRLNADLSFEREQLFRSSGDQQIASRLRGAGLPVDLNSPLAQQMRQNQQAAEMKQAVTGFVSDFRQQLVSSGGKIGEAAGKALLNSFLNAMTKAGDQAFERVINIIFSKLFNGTGPAGGASGLAGAGMGLAGSVLGAANDNMGKAPVIPVTRGPLGDVGSYIAQAALKRGIDPEIALKVARSEGGLSSWNLQSNYMKNGVREPSFGPYQLYMNGGLGNQFMTKTGLDPRLAANGPAGVDFALDYASKNGWSSWYGAAKVGVGKWDGIGAGGNMSAVDAVSKLATSASAATKGLDTFGGGLGTIGQTLTSSFFPPAPTGSAGGGGGLFGFLSGIFGGFKPAGGQAALAASGKITGLFADGTDFAPGGLAIVGERGRELVNLPRGSQVVPNHRTENMLAANGNRGGSGQRGPVPLNVNIQGANGDDHVRRLVEQGVAAGLDSYNKEMERSGFGSQQQHYAWRRA